MSGLELEVAQWARDHGAHFEVEPPAEVIRGGQAHLEFTVHLYTRPLVDERPRAARWAEAAEIRAKLEGVLQSLVRWGRSRAARDGARLRERDGRRASRREKT